ncbi:MarR family winged helix-turn-helix transcriptional regulator [Jiella mangrovi]|uniref:MarR family transcriptional regulator n=1 Tax=Jiella mangrovi TaxID=2821407 RepID=A0ABS4BD38_9HYPH|nr:MarR family transcriptional regulator [Jiella mangrovi]MBP0613984.1 MarR family transcriptional regulator [Jiella mangrovi]
MKRDASLQFELTSDLLRVGRVWRKLVRARIDCHEVSEACAHPLVAVGRLGDGVRQGALAEEVGMEGPSLVRLLDQLCQSGLVERREDPADRRAKTLWLTMRGRAVMESIETDLVAFRALVLKDVPLDDIKATLRVFAAFDDFQANAAKDDQQPSETPEETP